MWVVIRREARETGFAGCPRFAAAPHTYCLLLTSLLRAAPPTPIPQEEYALRQAAIKAEPLEIIYSYYNGTGHRRAITVSAGGGGLPGRNIGRCTASMRRAWAAE